jgi:hypothetical protein
MEYLSNIDSWALQRLKFYGHGKGPFLIGSALDTAHLFERKENTLSCKIKVFGRDIEPEKTHPDPLKSTF